MTNSVNAQDSQSCSWFVPSHPPPASDQSSNVNSTTWSYRHTRTTRRHVTSQATRAENKGVCPPILFIRCWQFNPSTTTPLSSPWAKRSTTPHTMTIS